MPHINVKLYPGRTEEQKQRLADAITENVVAITGCKDTSVSVAIEEVAVEDWAEMVYRSCILEREWTLYKKPGYNPFRTS